MIWGIFQFQFVKRNPKDRAWKKLKDMSGHDGKRNQMKGRAMSMRQKLSPTGWIFFTATTPLQISFLGSARVPFAQLTWGLIVLKLFPIKGWARKKYSFWIWGIFQLKMTWKEIKRKWQGNAKAMKGTEKTWMDMRGNKLKWKAMTIHKTTFPKLENFIYYPFPNYLSRFWAPMGYPRPKLTWSFNSFLFQEKVFVPKPPCCLWIWGFAKQMARDKMKGIWNGHELDTKGKEINGHVRTWKDPQKLMKFDHSGGYEAAQ